MNVKTAIATFSGWGQEVGMIEALEKLGISHEGTHHDAGDDAKNIAKILLYLLKSCRVF